MLRMASRLAADAAYAVGAYDIDAVAIAKIRAGQSLEAGDMVTGDVAQCGPQLGHAITGQRIEDAGSVAASRHQTGARHRAEVMRRVGHALADLVGDVVDRDELAARLKRGEVMVLDVRPTAEYAAGHIQGAKSMPITELRRQLRALPKSSEVVAYCRGPYCVYADDAVRELNRKGYRALRLIDGFPEWKRAGLPIEQGNGREP